MGRSIDEESSRPIMAPSVSSKRTSKRLSTFSAPSIAASDLTTQTCTTAAADPRVAEIKEWSRGLERLDQKRLQQQRYLPSQEKLERLGKLALGAKLDRALERRMTDQDAVFRPRPNLLDEKAALARSCSTVA